MNRIIGIILLIFGIVLIIAGINASESFSSGVSRVFTGSPTNKSMWLLGAGIVSTLAGAYLGFGKGLKM